MELELVTQLTEFILINEPEEISIVNIILLWKWITPNIKINILGNITKENETIFTCFSYKND